MSPPISDSEDSPSDDDNKHTEESKPKPSKESLENSFLLFEKSLKARENWLDKENTKKDAPILEITAVSEGEDNQELLEAIEELEPESETEFDNRIKTAIETAQKLMKETQKMGKEVNPETKENLDPGIPSSDEEDQPTPNPPLRTRKSVTFGPEIPATPDMLANVSPSTFKEPKAISTPYSSNKEDHPNTVTSSTRYKPRRMDMEIPQFSEKISENTHNDKTKNTSKLITSIPPELPTGCSSNAPTTNFKVLSCRENLTYLRNNYVHFLSADVEVTTPVGRLLIDIGAIDPQELKIKQPKIGEVLITPRGQYNVYSLIIKNRHFDDIDKTILQTALHNLRVALFRENITEFRISRQGDLTDDLTKEELLKMIINEFENSNIKISMCYGNVSTPPEESRLEIISENHNSKIGGHKGVNKTYQRIRERYFWPGIKEQVTDFVRKCKICQEQKIVRAKIHEPMLITDTPLDTFDKVSLDTVGKLPTTPDGNKHILTMQDNLSKYCIAVPIPDISAATIAHALAKNLISQYGAPKAILTDKGKGFVNNLLSNLSKIFGIKQITTSGYRPQSNGSLERSHAVLMDYVRAYAENYDDWDQLLPFAMFAYNTSVHSATKFTPFELVFGKIARTPSSFPNYEKLETYGSYLQELICRLTEIKNMAADNLIKAKQNSKLNYDAKARSFLGKVGDKVYVQKEVKKHGKLDSKYYGPFEIIKLLDKHTAILKDKNETLFQKHVDKLKIAYE